MNEKVNLHEGHRARMRSCDTLASPEDREATKNISLVLHKLDVQLTDHLIVTEGRTISLRQMGYVNLFY